MKRISLIPVLSILATLAIGATVQHAVNLTNFNAGELSPQMEGRIDFAKTPNGARELQNMIVRSQGPVTRRPGTKYIAEVNDVNVPARLIPFEYSTSDAYVLELSHKHLRFYRAGAAVLDSNVAYTLDTPWDGNDLFEIQFAQDAQIMRFVHPDYQPRKLVRNTASHTDWTLSAISFEGGPFLDENEDTTSLITTSATTGTITLDCNDAIWDANHVGALWQITHMVDSNTVSGSFWGTYTVGAVDEEGDTTFEANSVSLSVYEDPTYTVTTGGLWWGTILIQRSYDDGATWDTVKSFAYSGNGNILWTATEEEDDALYRLRMEDQGWISSHMKEHNEGECTYTLSTDAFLRHGVVRIATFVDSNEVTATVLTELGSTDSTWRWAEGVWSAYRGWPRTVEHHEQRCCYGGTASWPQTIWASITASQDSDYDDFDPGVRDAADAWTYVLPGMNPIQWMVSAEYLMVGTTEGVGRLGSPDKPIDPTWPPVYRIQARNGCAYLDAVAAVDAILYVERGNQKVREVTYTYAEDRYVAPDMTVLSEHIAREGIVQIDFADRPDPILWAVRNDGVLLSFTYERKHEVLAWARHITGQDPNDMTSWDDFESIAVIPGTSTRADGNDRSDDELWAVVKRTVDGNEVRYVEQFQPLDWGDDPNYCWFVDCAGYGEPTPGTPATESTYDYTYFSENDTIFGVPVLDMDVLCLDASGVAVNLGEGLVKLPYSGNPFEAGETVYITGTANYDGTRVLQAGTDASFLVLSDDYDAETFDGTETVVRLIDTPPGCGRMVRDSDGNLWIGHNYSVNATCVSKLAEDGTWTYDALTWPETLESVHTATALAMTDDDAYLYVVLHGSVLNQRMMKFDVATGACIWDVAMLAGDGTDMAIDADGNAYKVCQAPDVTTHLYKFDSATGEKTLMPDVFEAPLEPDVASSIGYNIEVDDDLGIVIAGGYQYCDGAASDEIKNSMFNLAVRTLDNTAGDQILLGSLLGTTILQTENVGDLRLLVHGGYIYALTVVSQFSGGTKLYKVQWNGSALSLVTEEDGPTWGRAIYDDPWGNIVVVNTTESTAISDLVYYYDDDLSLLGYVDGLPRICLTWDSAASGATLQGDFAFRGTPGTPGTPGTTPLEHFDTERDLCVYADGIPLGAVDPNTSRRATFNVDANGTLDLGAEYSVVIAGLNYFSILETMPLVNAETIGRPTSIKSVAIDFIDTMGCHVGSDLDHCTDWLFSADDFNTPIDPYTGYKPLMGYTPFLRGMTRKPVVYLFEYCPIPLTIRSITANLEVTFE